MQARHLFLVAAIVAPALTLAQEVGSANAASNTPGESPPSVGAPAAYMPGAALPAASLPVPGIAPVGISSFGPAPLEYTQYGASVGVGATDNVNLSATHQKAQALAAASLFFDLIRTGSRLKLTALGNFSDINYLEHAYKNQVLGRFDGLANLTLWQRHLTWLVRDDYGDSQIDPLQALTPTNIQRVNVFSTGPTLTLQPSLNSFVELQGLYSRNTYQDSPFSGNTGTASFTLGHQFSPSDSISIVGRVQQERFDNTTLNPDYQVREYYGEYSLKGSRTVLDLQAGLDQANDAGSWRSSPLVRVSITRNVSPFSTVSLTGGRDYINAMGGFASLGAGISSGIPVGGVAQTTANADHTYGNASWAFRRLRTTLSLFGGWERDAYDRESQFDFSRTDLGITLGRQLTPFLSANVTGTLDRSKYTAQGFTNDNGRVDAAVVYRPGAWVVITGRYDHQLWRASGVVANGLGYDENRVFIMIGYYPHSSGTGAPGQGGMGMGGTM